MCCEIAAVDTRQIERQKRFQSASVIPIVEVTAVSFQLVERIQCVGEALEQLLGGDIAKVPRSYRCEHAEADVGRRGACCEDFARILLEIIRRQPVIFVVEEGFEKAPRLTGGFLKKLDLLIAQ